MNEFCECMDDVVDMTSGFMQQIKNFASGNPEDLDLYEKTSTKDQIKKDINEANKFVAKCHLDKAIESKKYLREKTLTLWDADHMRIFEIDLRLKNEEMDGDDKVEQQDEDKFVYENKNNQDGEFFKVHAVIRVGGLITLHYSLTNVSGKEMTQYNQVFRRGNYFN